MKKLIKKIIIKNPQKKEKAMLDFYKRIKEKGY